MQKFEMVILSQLTSQTKDILKMHRKLVLEVRVMV